MANNQNLIPQAHKLTVEEQSKGGIASGERRRAKKSMSELAKIIANTPASDKNKKKLAQLGIEDEEATNNAAVVASVCNSALAGDKISYKEEKDVYRMDDCVWNLDDYPQGWKLAETE